MSYLDTSITDKYKSNSQKVRIMTEFWTGENIFCPNCGESIVHYENNKPVADFYCPNCREDYELKSGKNITNKITDGEYTTMLNRLKSNTNPNLFLLNYSLQFEILNFIAIPKYYFTSEVIEKRNPLSESARRA